MKRIKIFLLFGLLLVQSCEQKYPMKMGGNYYLDYNHSWGLVRIIGENNEITVNMEVVAWNFDSIFIITKQKPFWEIMDSIQIQYPNTSLDKEKRLYNKTEKYYY